MAIDFVQLGNTTHNYAGGGTGANSIDGNFSTAQTATASGTISCSCSVSSEHIFATPHNLTQISYRAAAGGSGNYDGAGTPCSGSYAVYYKINGGGYTLLASGSNSGRNSGSIDSGTVNNTTGWSNIIAVMITASGSGAGASKGGTCSSSASDYEIQAWGIVAPTVTTGSASSIATTTATLGGNITDTGGENNTIRGFQYGLDTGYGSDVHEDGSYGTGAYTLGISSLSANTLYHFRAYSTNSAGTTYGDDNTFTTSNYIYVFTDNFNDGVIDTNKWNVITSGNATVVEEDRVLKSTVTNSGEVAGISPKTNCDLTNSYISLKVVSVASVGDFSFYPIRIIADIYLHYWMISSGIINTSPSGYSTTYDPSIHKYLRIREASGIIYYDYSPTGVTWVNANSQEYSGSITNVEVRLGYMYSSSAIEESFISQIDNVNLLVPKRPMFLSRLDID